MSVWDHLPEMWSAVLDSSHNGIVVIDEDGIIVFYNRAARRIFGDRNSTIVGRHFSEIRKETWPDLRRVLRSGLPQVGKKLVLPEATIIANRTPVIADGTVVGAVSVFQDISEYEGLTSELQGYKKLHLCKGTLVHLQRSTRRGKGFRISQSPCLCQPAFSQVSTGYRSPRCPNHLTERCVCSMDEFH